MSRLLFQQLRSLVDQYGADKVRYTLDVVITHSELIKPAPYTCKLCGQRIDDGKPCDCGARTLSKSAPYPFCRHPDKCAGKGYCQHDPACNE
jgi:hypothetical protein